MTSTIHECSPADHMMSYEGASQSCLRCLDQCNGKGLDDDLGALWRWFPPITPPYFRPFPVLWIHEFIISEIFLLSILLVSVNISSKSRIRPFPLWFRDLFENISRKPPDFGSILYSRMSLFFFSSINSFIRSPTCKKWSYLMARTDYTSQLYRYRAIHYKSLVDWRGNYSIVIHLFLEIGSVLF